MPIHIIEEGNIFKFFINDRQVTNIAHGCNMKGLMGAGIAKQIKDMFPSSYNRYAKVCELLDWKEICLNLPYMVDYNLNNTWNVYNLFTQVCPGPNAALCLIEFSIENMLSDLGRCSESVVVIPAIGCGIGGLKFDDVVERLENVFLNHETNHINGIDLYVIKNFKDKEVHIRKD